MNSSIDRRQEYQSRHANKIKEINEEISGWGQLPAINLIDSEPFVVVNRNVMAYLMKEGDKIKIHTTMQGDLEISEQELGDRIGTGLDFLELLSRRLGAFKDLIFQKARNEGSFRQKRLRR